MNGPIVLRDPPGTGRPPRLRPRSSLTLQVPGSLHRAAVPAGADPCRRPDGSSSVSRSDGERREGGGWPLPPLSPLAAYSPALSAHPESRPSFPRRHPINGAPLPVSPPPPFRRPRPPQPGWDPGRLEITFTWPGLYPALPRSLSARRCHLHLRRRRRTDSRIPTRAHARMHAGAPFTGMTDSATHHSMDQELKQFALGGFPGSPRRLLRSHLLGPLRSPGCVSPLLLLSFPLPPVPLPCSTFLLFVLSSSALPVPDSPSPSPSPSFERRSSPAESLAVSSSLFS